MITEAAELAKDFFSWGKNDPGVISIAKDFASAYRHKAAGASNGEVLTGLLSKHLSGVMDETGIYKAASAITMGVDSYDAALTSMNESKRLGTSREEWLQKNILDNAPGETLQEKGDYLYGAYRELRRGNGRLMELDEETVEPDAIAWDEENLQDLAAAMAQEAATSGGLNGECAASPELLSILENGAGETEAGDEEAGFFEKHGKTIKTAAAGVLTVCTRLGKIPFLPEGTDVRVLTTAACAGVETLKAGFNFMRGKITASEVVDHIANAVSVGLPGLIKSGVTAAAYALYPPAGVAASTVCDKVLSTASQKVANVAAKGIKLAKPFIQEYAEFAKANFNAYKEVAKLGFNLVKNLFA